MGSFSADEIQSSILSSLLHLVNMIGNGPDIKSQLVNDRWKSDFIIAQLLLFNYHPNVTKKTVQQAHSLRVALLCQNGVNQQRNLRQIACFFLLIYWWSCHGEFNPPHKPIMFEGYANEVILPYIKSQVSKCSRVDIIFDAYIENSLLKITNKEATMNRDPAEGCWFRHNTEVLEQCYARKREQDRIIFLSCRADCIFTFVYVGLCYTGRKRSLK